MPQTKRQVRSFLGAIGYYRRYIQNFALIAKPLLKLTQDEVSNSKVPWDESCEIVFQTLKKNCWKHLSLDIWIILEIQSWELIHLE